MKYQLILTALAAAAQAQKPKGKAKCQTVAEILSKPPPDPLVPFAPGTADFPCNMGAAIPLGKVPTGCADLEIIVGTYIRHEGFSLTGGSARDERAGPVRHGGRRPAGRARQARLGKAQRPRVPRAGELSVSRAGAI
jgi:hypothetical protein